jgi:excisionase family DNA binding protein
MPSKTKAVNTDGTIDELTRLVFELRNDVQQLHQAFESAQIAPNPSRLLKLKEVGNRLGVSERTVTRLLDSKKLRRQYVGNSVRVSEADVDAFIAVQRRRA